jgi:hypothetical protein
MAFLMPKTGSIFRQGKKLRIQEFKQTFMISPTGVVKQTIANLKIKLYD